MIRRIYADSFRCLGNFEFRPGTMNLLLGENGSGKTSLFDALLLLRDLVIAGRSVAEAFTYTKTVWDQRRVQGFELEIEKAGGMFSYRLEIQHPADSPGKPWIQGEHLDLDGKPLFRFTAGQVRLFN